MLNYIYTKTGEIVKMGMRNIRGRNLIRQKIKRDRKKDVLIYVAIMLFTVIISFGFMAMKNRESVGNDALIVPDYRRYPISTVWKMRQ